VRGKGIERVEEVSGADKRSKGKNKGERRREGEGSRTKDLSNLHKVMGPKGVCPLQRKP
jgi:hypothetical protein